MIEEYRETLMVHYDWALVGEYSKCPLYAATETVEDLLLQCPDRRANSNQVVPLEEVILRKVNLFLFV